MEQRTKLKTQWGKEASIYVVNFEYGLIKRIIIERSSVLSR